MVQLSQARQLMIVSREEPDLHDYLVRAFVGVAAIVVLYDRREVDRRRRGAPTPNVERRRSDRRAWPGIDSDVRSFGWGVVERQPERPRP
ncbi:MAG TPA: hypothetical protein VGL09_07850 [Methylomirabilota bacterium]|jgi:hypothetical protein